MAQTAVEWLAEQIKEYDFAPITNTDEYAIVIPVWIFKDKLNQAKAMEKEKIRMAFTDGHWNGQFKKLTSEEYYEKTYTNGL